MSRAYLASGDALLDEYFDDERLKAALAWFGAQSGPAMSEPGTAPMVGFAALMHTLPPGRAVGGSGALSAALISRLNGDGGTVELGARHRAAPRGPGLAPHRGHARRYAHRPGAHRARGLPRADHPEPAGTRRIRPHPPRRLATAHPRGPRRGHGSAAGHHRAPAFDGVPLEDQSGLGLLVADRGHLARARGDMLAATRPVGPRCWR